MILSAPTVCVTLELNFFLLSVIHVGDDSIKNLKDFGASVTLTEHTKKNRTGHNEEGKCKELLVLLMSFTRTMYESERISPSFVLLHGDLSILAQIVGKVIPILTGVDNIATHNTKVNIAELIECFLFSHWSEDCVGFVSSPR